MTDMRWADVVVISAGVSHSGGPTRGTGRDVRTRAGRLGLIALALLAAVWPHRPASAQLSTATLRGVVTDAGRPAASSQVIARHVATGSSTPATADAAGRYVLSGLRPGTYEIRYHLADGREVTREATISVGQSATLDVDIPAPETAPEVPTAVTVERDTIVVTGHQLIETRTSEVATNISTRTMESLPQSSRNFLNFADLAPGVRSSTSPTRKTFSSAGVGQDPGGDSLAGPQVNVFIDGVSLKSDIQQGGIVGQDSSRGNPFPQAAVQEFRVLTSNFKAEYEDAGTSVINAVTKSGGNEFHGDVFFFFQNAALRAKDYFQKKNNLAEPAYKRLQYGASLGGPIIKDKLFFFGAYEGNDEDSTQNVIIGQPTDENRQRFGQYQGSFLSPFREDLAFAKLSWEADEHNWVDLSGSLRTEHEIAGFGAQTAREAASRNKNDVYTGNLRWQYDSGDFLNDAGINYVYYAFEPRPLNPSVVGQNFEGVVRIGGSSTSQKVLQRGFTLRDSVTFSNVDFLTGSHVFKIGAKASFQHYSVENALNENPVFNYRNDPAQGLDFSFPYEAKYGVGDPSMTADSIRFGVFAQDDWELDEHFTLNAGLRWDYETNANNNDYVTPPEAQAALRELEMLLSGQPGNTFRASDYISTGENRKPYWKAFQPRLGVSYDLFGDQSTVFFAGYGRYFDRTLFRNAAEETLFEQYESRTFSFSTDGQPRNGQPTIVWNPDLMSVAGLDSLIDMAVAPPGELRVLRNDARPPHTDQFTLGVRQQLYIVNAQLSYSHVEARDQVGYAPLNRSTQRNAMGFLDTIPVTGYGTVVGLTQDRRTRYDGVFLAVDKPYSKTDPWSLSLSYTLAFSRERGYAFNFDFPNVAAQPYRPNAGDERHRVVLAGLVDLPLDFQLSMLATWGTGQPYLVTNASGGYGERLVTANTGNTKNFQQVDVRLTKTFAIWRSVEVQLIAELFNVFNHANFLGYDGLIPPEPERNANFGQPNSLSGPPRSLQLGARARF